MSVTNLLIFEKLCNFFFPGKEWFWCTKLVLLSPITKIFYLSPWKWVSVVYDSKHFFIFLSILPIADIDLWTIPFNIEISIWKICFFFNQEFSTIMAGFLSGLLKGNTCHFCFFKISTRWYFIVSYHVLLCAVALNKAVGMLIFKDFRVGGIFGVDIHSHHSLIVTSQFGHGHPVCLAGGDLLEKNMV